MTEQKTVQLVIGFLGTITLAITLGAIYLTSVDQSIPDALIGLGGTSIGALAGILSTTSNGPQQVQVMNDPADAVPVEDAGDGGQTELLVIVKYLFILVIVVLVLRFLAAVI